MYVYIFALEVIIITGMRISNPLGKTILTGSSVVEFQFCDLWTLVRSPMVKSTIYTAVET